MPQLNTLEKRTPTLWQRHLMMSYGKKVPRRKHHKLLLIRPQKIRIKKAKSPRRAHPSLKAPSPDHVSVKGKGKGKDYIVTIVQYVDKDGNPAMGMKYEFIENGKPIGRIKANSMEEAKKIAINKYGASYVDFVNRSGSDKSSLEMEIEENKPMGELEDSMDLTFDQIIGDPEMGWFLVEDPDFPSPVKHGVTAVQYERTIPATAENSALGLAGQKEQIYVTMVDIASLEAMETRGDKLSTKEREILDVWRNKKQYDESGSLIKQRDKTEMKDWEKKHPLAFIITTKRDDDKGQRYISHDTLFDSGDVQHPSHIDYIIKKKLTKGNKDIKTYQFEMKADIAERKLSKTEVKGIKEDMKLEAKSETQSVVDKIRNSSMKRATREHRLSDQQKNAFKRILNDEIGKELSKRRKQQRRDQQKMKTKDIIPEPVVSKNEELDFYDTIYQRADSRWFPSKKKVTTPTGTSAPTTQYPQKKIIRTGASQGWPRSKIEIFREGKTYNINAPPMPPFRLKYASADEVDEYNINKRQYKQSYSMWKRQAGKHVPDKEVRKLNQEYFEYRSRVDQANLHIDKDIVL